MAIEDMLPARDGDRWKEERLDSVHLKLGIEHSGGEYYIDVGQTLAVTLVQVAGAPETWEYDDNSGVLDPSVLKPVEDFMIGTSHLSLPPLADERHDAIGLQCFLYEALTPGRATISLRVFNGSQPSETDPVFKASIVVNN